MSQQQRIQGGIATFIAGHAQMQGSVALNMPLSMSCPDQDMLQLISKNAERRGKLTSVPRFG